MNGTTSVKKTSIGDFIREVRQEAAKVTWPSRKETLITTAMVFAMSILAALFFFFVDQILAFGVRIILGLGA
jgi:preprotein translocase subunit SecE